MVNLKEILFLKLFDFCNLIFLETQRLYTPVGELFRICVNDYRVPDSDFIIKKNTFVFIPVYAIHHDFRFYFDPKVLDLERFSPQEIRNRSNSTFFPFDKLKFITKCNQETWHCDTCQEL